MKFEFQNNKKALCLNGQPAIFFSQLEEQDGATADESVRIVPLHQEQPGSLSMLLPEESFSKGFKDIGSAYEYAKEQLSRIVQPKSRLVC